MIVESLTRAVVLASCLGLSAQGAPPAASDKPVAGRWWGHATQRREPSGGVFGIPQHNM